MIESHTAALERELPVRGPYTTEPYEAAWAREAIFFVREHAAGPHRARVQISPDGMHWCDEGTELTFPDGGPLGFARVRHFGGWLRLAGASTEGEEHVISVHLVLKG